MTRTRSRLSLSWRVSLLIAALLVASAISTTAFAFRAIQAELYAQSDEAVGNIHTSVAAVIEAEYDDIERFRTTALDRRKASLQDVAAPLPVTLDALRLAVTEGTITQEDAQARALQLLKEVRFANNDYFFTYNRDLIAISHPDDRFEGRDLSGLQDPDGVFVLQEIRDVALNQGSGFVSYLWERLDGAEPSPKLGYVFHYEPWDWIIGTGVYIDDIDTEVAQRTELVAADLERTFEEITFAEDGFFFILDREGQIVSAASPAVRALADTAEGVTCWLTSSRPLRPNRGSRSNSHSRIRGVRNRIPPGRCLRRPRPGAWTGSWCRPCPRSASVLRVAPSRCNWSDSASWSCSWVSPWASSSVAASPSRSTRSPPPPAAWPMDPSIPRCSMLLRGDPMRSATWLARSRGWAPRSSNERTCCAPRSKASPCRSIESG